MWRLCRYVQDLALANDDFFAADQESKRALEDVRHLLAVVRVDRYEGAALEIRLRDHLALACHDLLRQHFGHFGEGDFVPAVKPDTHWLWALRPSTSARGGRSRHDAHRSTHRTSSACD